MFSFYLENARWLLGGFLLAAFSCFGQTFFISVWGAEIREAYGLSHGSFGLVYMMATLASAATLPFLGKLVDHVSVAKTAVIVMSMLALAAFGMAFASSVAFLVLVIYLLRLFGQGMMTHTAMTAMGRWFSENRGKAVSSASIGHQFSEALAPAAFVAIAGLYGWRTSWMVAALVLIVVALPIITILMKVERTPHNDNGPVVEVDANQRQWTRREMLGDPLFWLTSIGVFSPAFIGTSIFFHQDYLIELNGWNRWEYDASFAAMAATTVVVALIMGYAVDRWTAARLLPGFMVPLAGACFVLGWFSAPSTIFWFMLLLGMSYGISSTLFGSLWPEVYGTRHLGSLRSVIVSFMVFMSAAGPGVTGVLIEWGIPFPRQLLFIGLYCCLCVGLMIIASNAYRTRILLESSN